MYLALIDDHRLLTESIYNLLKKKMGSVDIKVYHNGVGFVSDNHITCPDIIITDLMMPGGVNGINVIDFCKEKFEGKAKVLVLSSITNVHIIRQTIRTGANGFLSKASPIEELVDAISTVIGGKQYISRNLRDDLLNTIFAEDHLSYHLSPREKDVLQKICSGKTIKETAHELNLSIHTVQYYHRNVLAKLNLKKTSDLIVFAMQNGLFIPDLK